MLLSRLRIGAFPTADCSTAPDTNTALTEDAEACAKVTCICSAPTNHPSFGIIDDNQACAMEHYCNVEYLEDSRTYCPVLNSNEPYEIESSNEMMAPVLMEEPHDRSRSSIVDSAGPIEWSNVGDHDHGNLDTRITNISMSKNDYGNTTSESTIAVLRQKLKSERTAHSSLKQQMQIVRKRLYASERKCKRKEAMLQSLRAKVRELTASLKQIRNKTKSDEALLKSVKTNEVIHNSLTNASRKPKGRRYNRQLRQFATSSYLCGPKAYRMIKSSKALCLPSKRSVKRWTNNIRIGPGLNRTIFEKLKQKANNLSEKDRVVIIAMDGMKIKSSLCYTAKNDTFHGFPDTGAKIKVEKNSPQRLASEAVTVMMRGVFSNLKQVICA